MRLLSRNCKGRQRARFTSRCRARPLNNKKSVRFSSLPFCPAALRELPSSGCCFPFKTFGRRRIIRSAKRVSRWTFGPVTGLGANRSPSSAQRQNASFSPGILSLHEPEFDVRSTGEEVRVLDCSVGTESFANPFPEESVEKRRHYRQLFARDRKCESGLPGAFSSHVSFIQFLCR